MVAQAGALRLLLPGCVIMAALSSSALVGMQPQLEQMPARCSRSTTATFAPSSAACTAAIDPAGPAPWHNTPWPRNPPFTAWGAAAALAASAAAAASPPVDSACSA